MRKWKRETAARIFLERKGDERKALNSQKVKSESKGANDGRERPAIIKIKISL